MSLRYRHESHERAQNHNLWMSKSRSETVRNFKSIPLNIAEGNGNQSLKDKSRGFPIARGPAWNARRFM
jgi:four helix bundle protein